MDAVGKRVTVKQSWYSCAVTVKIIFDNILESHFETNYVLDGLKNLQFVKIVDILIVGAFLVNPYQLSSLKFNKYYWGLI